MRGTLAIVLISVAACNGDRPKASAPATAMASTPSDAVGSAAATPGPLPADHKCLWLNVCDGWSGCAHVAQSGSAWKVVSAARLAPGDVVEVLDMCSGEPVCISARGAPAGVICPGHTVPPFIAEPDYTCEWTGTACVVKPKAKP